MDNRKEGLKELGMAVLVFAAVVNLKKMKMYKFSFRLLWAGLKLL